MTIGIDTSHALRTPRTGVEEACWQIIQALKKQIPSDVRVILYCQKELPEDFGIVPANWEVKILRWPLKKLWSQLRLAFELWRHPPETYFAPGQLLPLFAPKNSVVYLHDSAFLVYPKAYNFLGRQYLKWMNKLIIRKAKLIITSTEFNKQELVKYYPQYKNISEKVKVVPLAYDNERFFAFRSVVEPCGSGSPASSAGRQSLKPYIIFVGRLEEKKNVKRLVEAFDKIKLQSNIKNLQLLLVGKPGVGCGEIQKIIDTSPFKSDIFQPGYVGAEDLPGLISNAELLVLPSLYEGFGLPILEAFACGTPVVIADTPALREVGEEVPEYINPLEVEDLVRGLNNVLFNQDLRKKMKELGLERAKLFSWEKTGSEICRLLKCLPKIE